MNRRQDEYDFYKKMITGIKTINETATPKRRLITEAEDGSDGAIAITDDAKFGTNVLQNQIDAFRSSVNPGARFATGKDGNAETHPLVYFPKDKNLVFTGSIPSMSGLKFQFSLNDVTDGPYIFVDGLALTDKVLDTLKRLNGFYANWKQEWLEAGSQLEKLGKKE